MSELREAFERYQAHREEHAPEVEVTPESTPASITESVGDRGTEYLERLAMDAGVDARELLDVTLEMADLTTPNLLALHLMGSLNAKDYGDACVAAGLLHGFLIGVFLERAR